MALKKAERPVSKSEQRKRSNAEAMPDVREIVKRHGLTTVRSCVAKLHEFDQKEQEAKRLRDKADAIARELNAEADAMEKKLEQQRKAKLAG